MKLRPYQQQTELDVYAAWEHGYKDVLAVLPTGAGKTVTFSNIIKNHNGYAIAVAHRQELVSQISVALAREEIYHSIIAPTATIRLIVQAHMRELGRSYYNAQAKTMVAGVDTLIRREVSEFSHVTLWVQDEAHHVCMNNKWHKARQMFPNAKGLGVTATPQRADGKGLGVHADGVFSHMIVGPNMRDLIEQGYLSEYRVFAPLTSIDMENVNVTANGDYSKTKLSAAIHKSTITGDVVKHYIKLASGKLGVTFATDVESAKEIACAYNDAGIRAEVVCAKTNDCARSAIIEKFRRREVTQLVNVDLFGEGFDLPAIEVVSMARPTQSYGLYVQQFGRALRIMNGKDKALIIDHVGNVCRHGLPDLGKDWTLNRREKRTTGKREGLDAVKSCPKCTGVFERFRIKCPYCGFVPEPLSRSKPEFVDGDLTELDIPAMLALRAEIEKVDTPLSDYTAKLYASGTPMIGIRAHTNRHAAKQQAQRDLREEIAWWAAWRRQEGYTDAEMYRRFYLYFGIDVMTAQTLDKKEAIELTVKIKETLK